MIEDRSIAGESAAPMGERTDPGPGSLLGVFANPRGTFESMRERPRWRLALAVVLVIQLVLSYAVFQSGVIADETIAKLEAQGKSAQEIEAVSAFFEGPMGFVMTVGIVPFAVAIGVLAGAGILFFMAKFMLGALVRFEHALSAVVYSGIVMLADHIVRVALVLAKGTYDVRLGVGMFFGEGGGFGVKALDMATDPLFLWGNAVCAAGIAAYARKSFGFGVLAVLPGFLVAVLLSATR